MREKLQQALGVPCSIATAKNAMNKADLRSSSDDAIRILYQKNGRLCCHTDCMIIKVSRHHGIYSSVT